MTTNRHKFEQTLGDREGQESLAWCSPWGHKVSDIVTEQPLWDGDTLWFFPMTSEALPDSTLLSCLLFFLFFLASLPVSLYSASSFLNILCLLWYKKVLKWLFLFSESKFSSSYFSYLPLNNFTAHFLFFWEWYFYCVPSEILSPPAVSRPVTLSSFIFYNIYCILIL